MTKFVFLFLFTIIATPILCQVTSEEKRVDSLFSISVQNLELISKHVDSIVETTLPFSKMYIIDLTVNYRVYKNLVELNYYYELLRTSDSILYELYKLKDKDKIDLVAPFELVKLNRYTDSIFTKIFNINYYSKLDSSFFKSNVISMTDVMKYYDRIKPLSENLRLYNSKILTSSLNEVILVERIDTTKEREIISFKTDDTKPIETIPDSINIFRELMADLNKIRINKDLQIHRLNDTIEKLSTEILSPEMNSPIQADSIEFLRNVIANINKEKKLADKISVILGFIALVSFALVLLITMRWAIWEQKEVIPAKLTRINSDNFILLCALGFTQNLKNPFLDTTKEYRLFDKKFYRKIDSENIDTFFEIIMSTKDKSSRINIRKTTRNYSNCFENEHK